MSEPTPYDEVPYASHAYPGTHPDAMAGMARLFGMNPALPSRCRVLELGSAAGGNLIPVAAAYPESDFVGVDLSRVEIEEGQEHIKALGLSNVQLHTLDIMGVGEQFGTFDYIVCHGVFSWVPRAVQDEILALCRRLLNPQGVAYISYNCYPGWHMRGLIRDMMFYHSAPFDSPEEKVGQARALLDFLANTMPEGPDAYSVLLRDEAAFLRKMSDYYLFHEHLSPDNDPMYFHQFVGRAAKAELQFLGEARLTTMLPEQFPPEIREVLGQITGDIVRMEQYMDFVRNRTFRQTLLVHNEVSLDRTLDWEDLRPFHVACNATAPDDAVMDDRSEVCFENGEQTIVSEEPLVKLALARLAAAWPATVPYEELLDEVVAQVGAEDPADARASLGSNLLRCVAGGIVEYWSEPSLAARAGDRPRAWSFVRYQIESGIERLTTLRHQTADVAPVIKRMLVLMDGARDRAAIIDGLVQDALDDKLTVSQDDEPITDEPALREVFAQVYDEIVGTVEQQSFLVG